ncbi:MAG: outer membrane beta-barrel protein [Bacteroides sp.]|nr:outer membrane beta-barrel protein [Bacteroides sp.]
MKRISCGVIITLISMLAALPAMSQKVDWLYLNGRIRDAATKAELTKARVLIYDAKGNVKDSTKCESYRYRNGERTEIASFVIPVERKDSIYHFDVVCPGYKTETITYAVENVGKRERSRTIPVIFLERQAKTLSEVTVTASKVKFYNKGDTLVFNADAFQLAEGSMLDALIAQLPGVELKDDGRILVNGEYVETLLLNGKDFFKGDNKLMLENIGAYTVKNVEVYKGQTHLEKWENIPTAEKHLTMDVKLKKEYNLGLILNAQAAGGTKDRYLGRLFASWFTPTTNITLLGNANNLNDNRKPGKNDSWTPEMMPSGTKRYKMAAMNYDYQSADDNRKFNGYVNFESTSNNNLTTTNRTNFLSSGNTYDNSFSHSKNTDIKLETRNYATLQHKRWYWWHMVLGRYIKRDSESSSLSASFNREQADITAKAIEALYSAGTPDMLDAIINRSISRSETGRREWEVQFYPTYRYKIPGTNDILRIQGGLKYQDRKDDQWRDFNINYGSDPTPAEVRRQYFDNSPIRTLTLDATADYQATLKNYIYFGATYSYRFQNRESNSAMYELDQLADMGIFGTLPAGYQSTFDPMNSFTSRTLQNKHDIGFNLSHFSIKENYRLVIDMIPVFSIDHQNLNYKRNNKNYPVKRTSFLATSSRYILNVRYAFKSKWEEIDGKKKKPLGYVHELDYSFKVDTKTPDLMHMIDIENDSDPLNISVGNPDLKNSYTQKHEAHWSFKPAEKYLTNSVSVVYERTYDALVRGYTYNTSTGVRHNRTYNVDGNSASRISNYFNLQFGSKKQFSLASGTGFNINRYADMIGVDMDEPEKSRVKTNYLSQQLNLGWTIGKQSLHLAGSITNRHTTSTREGFNPINANHYQYGFIGQFRLPAGFGINTDFTFYTRDGYGSRQLDTTDIIWNMQLSYTPRGGHWVFMLDSFDMLHQLSNVNYGISASGRTITYSNALPRYVMLSVQYRLNIQPKKR